jgi:hypothetical protein
MARRASTSGAMGRFRMCASPSTTTVPSTVATAAVRKRVAVPALPRKSGFCGAARRPVPVTTKLVASGSSTVTPMSRRAAAISTVSLLFSAPVSRLVPDARAATKRARLVMDFEPGGLTRPVSGRPGGTMVRASGSGSSMMPAVLGESGDRRNERFHIEPPAWTHRFSKSPQVIVLPCVCVNDFQRQKVGTHDR